MSTLDTAYAAAKQDPEQRSEFYNLFLNTELYIPVHGEAEIQQQDSISPVLVESHGLKYLMLFDSEQRLTSWMQQEVNFVMLTGHQVVDMITADVHWALNVGTEYAKNFVPDEINWLKQVVANSQQQKAAQKPVSVLVRTPKDLPDGLKDTLNKQLATMADVNKAYLGQVHYAIEGEAPHLTLVLEGGESDLCVGLQESAQAFFKAGEHFDVLLQGQSGVATEIIKSQKPFYSR